MSKSVLKIQNANMSLRLSAKLGAFKGYAVAVFSQRIAAESFAKEVMRLRELHYSKLSKHYKGEMSNWRPLELYDGIRAKEINTYTSGELGWVVYEVIIRFEPNTKKEHREMRDEILSLANIKGAIAFTNWDS